MIELTEATFEKEVLTKSFEMPVLVDFWADWCAPCKMLAPVLEQLADDHPGQLQIAKVNTDVERVLAQQHGIRSLPTLRLYRNGELVEELLGAQPVSALKAMIDPYLARASDRLLQQALDKADAGQLTEAWQLLESAWQDDPDNPRLPFELAELYIDDGQFDKAGDLLGKLPLELRQSDQGKALALRLELAAAAADADADTLIKKLESDATDSETRFRLAARQVMDGNYDAALDNFMELLRRDRGFHEGAARRGLLAVFALLGEDDPRVASYRRKLFALLH
ncbi:MAG: thioredoxin [Gammaproteobacteria bacterium]|jgi:putative thioredoxin